MTTIVKKIIGKNLTREDASKALLELRSRTEEHFFGQADLSGEDADLVSGIDKGNFAKEFSQAEKDLEQVDELIVYSAVVMPAEQMAKLGHLARQLFKEELLLDWRVDPQLIGGAALAFGGNYRDYSLRARLVEKRAELRAVYRELLAKGIGHS